MTLRQKTLLLIGLAIGMLSVILFFSANVIMLGGFRNVENRETESNLSRAVNSINVETASLAAIAEEWGSLDDTFRFAIGTGDDFVRKNATPSVFLTRHLHLLAVFDAQQNFIYGTLFNPAAKKFIPLPDSMRNQLQAESALFAQSAPEDKSRGLLMMPESPLLVASRPILEPRSIPPLHGYMVVGRFLDAKVLSQIAGDNRLSLQIQPFFDPNLPADFFRAAQNFSEKNTTWVDPIDEKTIAGYSVLKDLHGRPGLILRIDSPRFIYLQGQKTFQYFSFILIALALLFGITNLFLMEKAILKRLSSLSEQIFSVGKLNSPSLRVQISGNDELTRVADSINGMLSSLEAAQNELKESDAATRALLDGLPDFLLRIDARGTIMDFKTARGRAAATPPKLLPGNTIMDAYPAPLAEKMAAALALALETQSTQLFEHETVINSQVQNQEIRITPINATEAIAVVRDFTERKQLEKSLQFFNLRDPLTGLFNRTYWEEKLVAVSHHSDAMIGFILCEIDEMRLIQDTLGPDHCDILLTATASALRTSVPLDAFIARTGPEDFAVMVIGTTENELKKIERKIRQEVARSGEEEVQLRYGVSLGYAIGTAAETGLQELLRAAQNRLHREKLSHSQSSRNNLFQSMQIALETRDFVTHQHAARLWALGRSLAKEAGLPDRHLRNFKLLTQFHDIGKVGVSDDLIFKQGQLTPDEMKQMKMHVEIGHRIAQSIPELSPIADLLLKHHEWWNGAGYPLGLQGEEIPLEIRVFSIVDAFDAMTNDRPDRKALSVKEAAAELRRCAGSQFDPDLVMKFLAMLGEES